MAIFLPAETIHAQLTNHQSIVTKSYTGPTVTMGNTPGTFVGNVIFQPNVDIPLNHKIVEVIVEIEWSKTDDGSCTPTTGIPADMSHVGFQIRGPIGGTRYLATSTTTAAFAAPITTASFTGLGNVNNDVIVFRDAGNSLLPAAFPVLGQDTVAPNNQTLDFYCGQDPYGIWQIGGIDDAPAAGPQLCIHSYSITLVTCDFNQLEASCKVNPSVTLGPAGVRPLVFEDVDSISDVSCNVRSITFSPATINCSDVGSTIPVVMTIRDHLDSVASCMSTISVIDTNPPILQDCLPTIFATHYLNSMGRDTFWSDSVRAIDNCFPIIKEVRPFNGGTWGSFVAFNCSQGFQQFWARVRDASGNVDSCRLVIDMRDTIAPTAVCGNFTAYLTNAPNGDVTVFPGDIDAGSFDVCPPIIGRWIGSQFAPPPVYTCANLGMDTVILIVSDVAGNLDTCDNAIITIVDTLAPTAVCGVDSVYLDATGVTQSFAVNLDNGSFDNCFIDSLNINGQASVQVTCADLNLPKIVTLNVFDASGNTDACIASIFVFDTIPPVASCANVDLYIDQTGTTTVLADSLNSNSLDVCTGTNLTFDIGGNPSITFDCSALASTPNPVTLTVRDSFGNASTCIANVSVWDTVNPVANCAAPTVYLNASGIATVTAAQLSAGSSDNCAVTDSFVNVIGGAFATFDCSAIFTPQTATLIVNDAQGRTASCVATVTVEDTIRPTALCRNRVVASLNAVGQVTVYPSRIDSNSTDNCGLVLYQINNADSVTYTCADLGLQVATLLVQDSSGNQSTCTAQVEVQDNLPPTISCQSITTYLNSSGVSILTPADIVVAAGTNDNCQLLPSSYSFASGSTVTYTCDSIGTRRLVTIVSDNYGNSASCTTFITVEDSIKPVASCRPVPFTVQLDATGVGYVYPQDIDNGSFDLCGLSNLLINGVDSIAFTCASIGSIPSNVTLTVLDSTGNQANCIARVIVNDPISPIASCRDTTVYLGANGLALITPQAIDAGSNDNCSYTATIGGLASGTFNCSQVGTNTIQLIVTDPSNNSTQCPANVTVLDTIDPQANCVAPGQITVYLDNTCFASIPASTFNNGSTDNCSNNLSFQVGGLPNATFNATNLSTNPTPVDLVVRDPSGNRSTCSTTVIVLDTFPPTVSCRPDSVQLTGVNTSITPIMISAGATDNCSVPSLTINGQPSVTLDCNNLGTTMMTLIATDINGRSDSCTTTVFLEDVAAPTANCNANTIVYLDPTTNIATLQAANVDNGSLDNCSIASYLVSRDTFDCSDVIPNSIPVQLIVTDQSGNSDSCTTQVIVRDTISPVASCGSDTLFFSGSALTIAATALDAGSIDNCTLTSFSLSQDTFDCPDIGVNNVTLTIQDQSGNQATCTALVTVIDTAASATAGNPQVLCSIDSTTMTAMPVGPGLTGTWSSTVASTISSTTDPQATITDLPNGVNVFYWTVSSATCANLSQDSIVIEVIPTSPDIANAGVDQVLCDSSTITLAATTATISTGAWMQDTTQAASIVSFANAADSITTVAGLLPGNSYTFVWELTNGACGIHETDTVVVAIDAIPADVSNAGTNVICSPDTVMLMATTPNMGMGMWSSPHSVTILDPAASNTSVTDFVQDTTMLIWALSNGVCLDYSVDTVYIIRDDVRPNAQMDSFNLIPNGLTSIVDVTTNDFLPPNWSITIATPMNEGLMTNLNDGRFEIDINNVVLNQFFVYEICNTDCPTVCDTAGVRVGVQPPGDCYTPNAFTPNNDGANDFFVIPCLDNVTEKASLHIFNRWGNLVFETDNYVNDWDGTHRNRPLPDAVYFYILQVEGKSPQQGSIEIKR